MNEEWIETGNNAHRSDTIIKVSNRGRILRKNGTIEESTLYKLLAINGKLTFIHRFIAKHFLPKTDEDIELGRDCIDHWTHNPIGMNVNDIRNLRWCTRKENNNFDERRENISKGKTNKPKSKSEFGIKYYDHYGYSNAENPKQYIKEYHYYQRNKKFSWE